ncbi:hypothetical protein V3C99_001336 [Haemonchus contortus]
MLTTCITVTIIFTMLMYEISHSMKDVVDEAIDNIITDDTSTILRYARLIYEES